ncbi:unnamed protein product [Clonostachys rosea]|uniref:NAD(P)-binding protein n=1 Tax=Bionectria ochroleuca TaxID=29856 RepID=A0ABY6U931_BIOOC|nr:unnamed protein product [Clonostachys rosea]
MSHKNVLVVGANRGFGLSLVKAYARLSWNVTGSIRPKDRDHETIYDPKMTGANILEIDFLDEETIRKAAEQYGDKPLDILINVGGSPPQSANPWQSQSGPFMLERFHVMAVVGVPLGPLLVMKHFLPKLEMARKPKIMNISSNFGSISGGHALSLLFRQTILTFLFVPIENSFGTCMAYRTAEAALNQISMTLSREWKEEDRKSIVFCVEPGFLPTQLTTFDDDDDMETYIKDLMKIVDKVTSADSGALLDWTVTRIPF